MTDAEASADTGADMNKPYSVRLAADIRTQAQRDFDAGDGEIAAYLVGRADALDGRPLDVARANEPEIGSWYVAGFRDEQLERSRVGAYCDLLVRHRARKKQTVPGALVDDRRRDR